MADGHIIYTPYLHAVVGDAGLRERDEVVWVVLSRWDYPSEASEVCVEYVDYSLNDCGDDACFRTEQEAKTHAASEFGLSEEDWIEGAPWPRDTGPSPGA